MALSLSTVSAIPLTTLQILGSAGQFVLLYLARLDLKDIGLVVLMALLVSNLDLFPLLHRLPRVLAIFCSPTIQILSL